MLTGRREMTKLQVRVRQDVSEELVSAYPQFTIGHRQQSTTLTGEVADQQELFGLLNLLNSLGIQIVDVITLAED